MPDIPDLMGERSTDEPAECCWCVSSLLGTVHSKARMSQCPGAALRWGYQLMAVCLPLLSNTSRLCMRGWSAWCAQLNVDSASSSFSRKLLLHSQMYIDTAEISQESLEFSPSCQVCRKWITLHIPVIITAVRPQLICLGQGVSQLMRSHVRWSQMIASSRSKLCSVRILPHSRAQYHKSA